MFFFNNDSGKAKAKKRRKKKLKKKQRLEDLRRTHIIVEARKKHMKNRKDAEKHLSKGGFTSVAKMEDDDLGLRVSIGIEKTIQAGGKAIEKLKKRQKSVAKSRNTHLAKLQAARNKMVSRSRT